MSIDTPSDARLNFRLSSSNKAVIEEAAASLGQSVSDFAVATLVQTARKVVEQENITKLSNRDRDVFLAVMDTPGSRPNKALRRAATRYKKHLGKRS